MISRETWQVFLRVCVRSFVPRGALEDLAAVPGDVDDVHFRLARPRDEKRLARELIHGPARLIPGDIQAGHADPPVLGDADDAQVEQCVVQSAESQRVRYLVRSLLAVPAHVRRVDPDGVAAERAIEPAHRALIGIGTQDFFGETAAPRPGADGLGRPFVPGEVKSGDVEVDRGADQFGQDGGEVLFEEQPRGRSQGPGAGEEPLHRRAQAAHRSPLQQPGAAFGRVRADFPSRRIL